MTCKCRIPSRNLPQDLPSSRNQLRAGNLRTWKWKEALWWALLSVGKFIWPLCCFLNELLMIRTIYCFFIIRKLTNFQLHFSAFTHLKPLNSLLIFPIFLWWASWKFVILGFFQIVFVPWPEPHCGKFGRLQKKSKFYLAWTIMDSYFWLFPIKS